MGRGQEVGQVQELGILRRLGGEHVEGGARQASLLEHALERPLVHQAAARGVDEDGLWLHQGQPFGVQHVPGGVVERHVQGDHVRRPEKGLQPHRLHVVAGVEFREVQDVVGKDAASEGAQQGRQVLADMAAADDADGPVGKLPADGLAPGAGAHLGVDHGHVAQQGDGKAYDQFGHGPPVAAAGPAEPEAVTGHGPGVDGIQPDAVFGHHLEPGQGGENGVVHAFQPDDDPFAPREEGEQPVAGKDHPLVVEGDIVVARQQFGAQHRVARKRARGDRHRHRIFGALHPVRPFSRYSAHMAAKASSLG